MTISGLRIGEACGLAWQDLNLEEQCLTIMRSIRYDGSRHKNIIGLTKRKKVRIVDFGDTLTEILRNARKEQLKNRMQYGALYYKNYYREVKDKNRVYYEFYHLDGTEEIHDDYKEISVLANGAAPKDVQELLGHSDVSTTMNVYAHSAFAEEHLFFWILPRERTGIPLKKIKVFLTLWDDWGQYISVRGKKRGFKLDMTCQINRKPFADVRLAVEIDAGEEADEVTPEQIEELVMTHMDSVFQFCCFLTGNRSDAEDLSQDTFLKVLEIKHKFHWNEESRSDRNYLIGIAVNLWKNQQRKRSRRQRIAPTEPLSEIKANPWQCSDMEERMLDQELGRLLKECISDLPDKHKIVIHMFYSAQMSMDEIAKTLHIPKETVKSRLRLAKGKLRKKLEVHGYEV